MRSFEGALDRLPGFPGYRIERVLGRGGFGTVFAAERLDDSGGPRVAIKVAHAEPSGAARRLALEIEALRMVGPPHVPAVLGVGQLASGSPYVVMELVEGPTLAERLVGRSEPLSAAEACAITASVVGALAAIHAQGLVHRDLKPENVILAGERVVIVDLGTVRRLASPARDGDTRAGTLLGTLEYMAPEQCEGRADVDERADLYAVGVMLYEMLAGHPPFWGPPAAVREGHLSRRPLALAAGEAGATAALGAVALRCLAKAPADRYPSAKALATALAMAMPAPGSRRSASPAAPISRRSAPPIERRTVSLLHFASVLDPIALRTRIEHLGGFLMRASAGTRGSAFTYVVAFGHEADENPARLALRAAQELLQGRVCERVLLDLATVRITTRENGAKRLVSPLVARADRAPAPGGPAGIVLAPAARAVLSDADLDALLSSHVSQAEVDRANVPPSDEPTTRLGATSPQLFGRDELLAALIGAALRAADERVPTITAVIGDAGVGKSHLRRMLLERLRHVLTGAVVLDLRAREPVTGGGSSVRELLEEMLCLPAGASLPERLGALRQRLGPSQGPEAEAAIGLALGWVSAPHGDEAFPGLRVLEAAPGALRAVLTVAAGEALRRRAAEAPLFVVLDDAHFADEATLSILEHAALSEASAPIFICALGRPAFTAARPGWGERAAHREIHRLDPLDLESAEALCRALLLPAEHVPTSAVRRLVARAQGIPLLLVELIRGLKGEGIVRRHVGGRGYYLATDELDKVPDLPLIEWLANREIDALAPYLRAHARLLATLGAEVEVEEVAGVLQRLDRTCEGDAFPLDAGIGIDRLLAAGMLQRQRQHRIGFHHALVREAIARGTPEALRLRIHLAAVEYYRDAPEPRDERKLGQLAHHAAQAGLCETAEAAYLSLAEAARARHAYLDAERFYSCAIEQARGTGGRLREAYRGRGLMRHRLGRYDDALADLSVAREAARDSLEEAEILLDEATALDWMGDHVASRERVEQAAKLSEGRRTPALSSRLLLGMARTCHRFSQVEEAVTLFQRAAEEAASLGEEGYETQVIALFLLGYLEQVLGRADEAERALDRAVTLAESHGDALHQASSINCRGLVHACRGDRERMIADFERVISLGRELGQDTLELAGHYNLGEYLYLMDHLDAAAPHVARALAIEEKRTSGAPRPETQLLEARLLYYRGDEAAARRVVERLRSGGAPLTVPSDDVLCSMVELGTRDADDADWDELLARSARFSVGQERIEVTEMRGVWALRRGRREEAARFFDGALVLSARIPNAMGERLARRRDEVRRLRER